MRHHHHYHHHHHRHRRYRESLVTSQSVRRTMRFTRREGQGRPRIASRLLQISYVKPDDRNARCAVAVVRVCVLRARNVFDFKNKTTRGLPAVAVYRTTKTTTKLKNNRRQTTTAACVYIIGATTAVRRKSYYF